MQRFIVSVLLLLMCGAAQSQDTSYYVQYPTKLFIGYYQALQNYTITIAPDPTNPLLKRYHNYSSGGKTVSGIELGYDKLLIAVNFRTVKNNLYRRGDNKVFNLAIKLGSNKFQFEGLVQRSKGFYDANSPNYNVNYESPNPFYRNGRLSANLWRFNALYFPNHNKLAIKAIQGNNFRQLKSAISPVLTFGFYKSKFYAPDALVAPELATFFGSQSSLYEFRALGLLAGGGLAGTLVFYRKLFLSGVGIFTIEPQSRKYSYRLSNEINSFKVSVGTAVRLIIGYNSENFYTGFWINSTIKAFNGNFLKVGTNLSSAGFSIAFRINVRKEPGWVQNIKANKYYKML